ncbi:plasma-membrane calcium-translocating P-type ATPase [Georgenia satyanarayanai]|uniref:Plasma-membrane calcium-translocating P-type ATPase n=1 Tax=Georgenia satyanarayanai TaxID=860221 RepID=A0A2Y9AW16_9MICO|nr:HAD-IC family P-type ATPase [Georgenia satyanarayanai]PYF97243.1 calcium-translocating P-type ATPase [Georgenia satyanarayanai]SSA46329.1 plasma-membrane calcium-translocating P-type ATPase [Georgenia satyanarayanai]
MTPPTEAAPAHAHAHARAAVDVLTELATGDQGLSSAEAAARLARHGPNRLPDPERESALRRLLRQFRDPMIYVLIAAAVLTAVLGEWVDTIVIAAVVLTNAVIGYVQEGKAEDALEGIRQMLSLDAQVRRDGAWQTVPAEDLVPGDLVRLSSGDRVPADVRLSRASALRIEESALTGESVPVDKGTDPVAADAGVGDRTSMAFSGTVVAAGSGTGVVTATGQDTEIGHITTMLEEVESLETPLTRQMNAFGRALSLVVVVLAVVMFGLGALLYDYTLGELTLAAIGFAVAAIPEGLPAVLTITLALGVQTMARRNAITRRMSSVETLGSVTVICTDKTGTLTRNEMTVRTVVTPAGRVDVTGTGYAPEGEILPAGTTTAQHVLALAEVAARANDSTVSRRGEAWVLSGEPTDGGLRTFALKAGVRGDDDARVDAVPFDSAYKYMATLDRTAHGTVVHLKGAPDRLLDRCDSQGTGPDDTAPLDRAFWEAQIDELGARGLRVLAAAARRADDGATSVSTEDVDAGGFVLLGLYGIIDPPREEAVAAIRACRQAGIRVKMITGDHAGTATAIAREMGIGESTVTGAELETATDEELRTLATEHDVFARTSPEHKLRLVQALQANGEVVSMTGDGVNDAPSLKRADVGVAMGIKGTEATKEAADVVLADDNFASIESAVEMGRTIYDNLRKAIVFILPTNGAQGLVILVAVLLGLTLPLTPVQVLWVNTITAVTLALALAFEPSEPDIMRRPPRTPGGSILPRSGLLRIGYVSVLIGGATIAVFLLGQEAGRGVAESRTVAVNTLVVAQICYLFASRFSRTSSLRRELLTTNPVSWVCVAVMLALQLLFVYAPFMHTAFGSTAVGLTDWLVPLGVGVVVFAVVEVDKALRRR